jgi:hypothetical protein
VIQIQKFVMDSPQNGNELLDHHTSVNAEACVTGAARKPPRQTPQSPGPTAEPLPRGRPQTGGENGVIGVISRRDHPAA